MLKDIAIIHRSVLFVASRRARKGISTLELTQNCQVAFKNLLRPKHKRSRAPSPSSASVMEYYRKGLCCQKAPDGGDTIGVGSASQWLPARSLLFRSGRYWLTVAYLCNPSYHRLSADHICSHFLTTLVKEASVFLFHKFYSRKVLSCCQNAVYMRQNWSKISTICRGF